MTATAESFPQPSLSERRERLNLLRSVFGANKLMHVVLDPLCTGCELCVPACPVDCIVMELRPDAA